MEAPTEVVSLCDGVELSRRRVDPDHAERIARIASLAGGRAYVVQGTRMKLFVNGE